METKTEFDHLDMAQEEKQSLLKDICSMVPYNLKCRIYNSQRRCSEVGVPFFCTDLTLDTLNWIICNIDTISDIKPYLRPMSSMTEEEREDWYRQSKVDYDCEFKPEPTLLLENCHLSVDWLNRKRFDYRGLIPMGIALEAEEGMYV